MRPMPGTLTLEWLDRPRRRWLGSVPSDRQPTGGTRRFTAYLAATLGGLALAIAWLVPLTAASALLGWVAAGWIVVMLRSSRALMPAYGCGLIGHAVGFWWIMPTVAGFGGFGPASASAIFALFVAVGALQFGLMALIHRNLGPRFEALALRTPTSAVVGELISIRLFRWHFGHTQIAFTPFVQVAGIGGAMLATFLMFWLAEAAVRTIVFGERRRAFLLPLAAFGLAIAYGSAWIASFDAPGDRGQDVIIVQGDGSLLGKRDLGLARQNAALLHELSRRATRPGALIVWPEGSIPAYIPAGLGDVRERPALPWFGDGSAWLVGASAFDEQRRRFNAAFAVLPDGKVPRPYFKRILIPFGESMPLASVFPGLRSLNARAGRFTAGTESRVFPYPIRRSDGETNISKVAPLICFEDTVPALARQATRQGAQLLVNLTSDSWFGRTVAPAQHHLIAAFRAIENRRYLVRATTTGLSGVIDPLGRTIATIPPFKAGTATVRVALRDDWSLAAVVGDWPWWTLLVLALAGVIRRWFGGDRPPIEAEVRAAPAGRARSWHRFHPGEDD